jgi:predicted O-linked N-acetylglucosamine transferase (SPINDLY family)
LLCFTQLRTAVEYKGLSLETNVRLFNTAFFLPYFQDEPVTNRWIQNRLASIAANNTKEFAKETEKRFHPAVAVDSPEVIKIGFASHCFRQHSVGWLSRWFFKHYDREKFQVYLYFHASEPENAFAQEWFIKNAWQAHSSTSSLRLAEQVHEDKIDILVDLDSITLDTTCELMALKPAPIQVTWLGWDASGVPGIDYYIADPYVLPDNAQDYYQEKIWRLPQTYLAVDGFEVGVPTLRRDDLDIPTDAVVYLSAQRGYKRHLDTARLQMKILKEVPNSYFVIKGLGDTAVLSWVKHNNSNE